MRKFDLRTSAPLIAGCIAVMLLLWACAPGAMIPLIQTPTPSGEEEGMGAPIGCQGIQLVSACDPRPHFENYASNGLFEEFAWDLFLYMNWPAKPGERGVPDPTKSLADRSQSTWETWKDLREAIVADPAPWETLPASPDVGFYSMRRIPQISSDAHWISDTINIPPREALFGLRMNKAAFDYILSENLNTVEGQLAFVADPTREQINFPREAIEVKPTWIFLNAQVCNETSCPFHVANITSGAVGLTGLHIMSKVQENWFWATFEHVDNQANTNAPMIIPPTARAEEVNARMQAQLAGTVWENYMLRGAQWDFVDSAGNPTFLANTQIETRFQPSSSCMTCHSLASRGSQAAGVIPLFQLNPDFEGWVGKAPWQLFCEDGDEIVPDGGPEPRGEEFCEKYGKLARYRSTDYAWVLRLASRARDVE